MRACTRTTSSRPRTSSIAHGPAFGVERWEEQSGYSPSTIAAEIAGLVAAADLADANGDAVSAAIWRGVADDYQRSVKGWTVTTNGPLADHPYFIRLSKTGDPNAAITYNVGNGGPTLDQRSVIDAGFLELDTARRAAGERPDVAQSLPVVDATIKTHDRRAVPAGTATTATATETAPSDGHPWAPSGPGHGPPLAGAVGRARRAAAADRRLAGAAACSTSCAASRRASG